MTTTMRQMASDIKPMSITPEKILFPSWFRSDQRPLIRCVTGEEEEEKGQSDAADMAELLNHYASLDKKVVDLTTADVGLSYNQKSTQPSTQAVVSSGSASGTEADHRNQQPLASEKISPKSPTQVHVPLPIVDDID